MKHKPCTLTEKMMIVLILLSPFIVGFAGGYATRGYLNKQQKTEMVYDTVDRLAAAAQARALNTVTCDRCHGED